MGCVNSRPTKSNPDLNSTPQKPHNPTSTKHPNNANNSPNTINYIAINTQNTFNNQYLYQSQQVSANPQQSENERKKAILQMYKIDKQERLPNVPKINAYNYQTLLVHNPVNVGGAQ